MHAPLGVAHLPDECSRGGSDFLLVLSGGREVRGGKVVQQCLELGVCFRAYLGHERSG